MKTLEIMESKEVKQMTSSFAHNVSCVHLSFYGALEDSMENLRILSISNS